MVHSSSTVRRLREVVSMLVFVIGMFAARSSLAEHYYVPTGSMIPTIQVDDRLLVNKAAYGVRLPFSDIQLVRSEGPRRGDVAVLRSPDDDVTLVKRVVAVPGDEVAVQAGRVWLNGETVEHQVRPDGGGPDFGPVRLSADQYLVLGDNRGNSRDGRVFGLVGRHAFLGRAVGVFWSGGRPIWHRL